MIGMRRLVFFQVFLIILFLSIPIVARSDVVSTGSFGDSKISFFDDVDYVKVDVGGRYFVDLGKESSRNVIRIQGGEIVESENVYLECLKNGVWVFSYFPYEIINYGYFYEGDTSKRFSFERVVANSLGEYYKINYTIMHSGRVKMRVDVFLREAKTCRLYWKFENVKALSLEKVSDYKFVFSGENYGLEIDWSDVYGTESILTNYLVTDNVIMKNFEVYFQFDVKPNEVFTIDPYYVVTPGYYAFQYTNQRKVFYANNGYFYIFYQNTSNYNLAYAYSNNGINWSVASVAQNTNTNSDYDSIVSAWYDGQYVRVVTRSCSVCSGLGYYLGVPQSNGLIDWIENYTGADKNITVISSMKDKHTIVSSRDGYVWVVFYDFDYNYPHITKSQLNNGSWGGIAEGYPKRLYSSNIPAYLVPLGQNGVGVVIWDDFYYQIRIIHHYNGTDWRNSTPNYYINSVSSVVGYGNDTIYVVGRDLLKINVSDFSITNISSLNYSGPATIDEEDNRVFIFSKGCAGSLSICYQIYYINNNSFSPIRNWFNESGTIYYLSSFYNKMNDRIGLSYSAYIGSSKVIKFDFLQSKYERNVQANIKATNLLNKSAFFQRAVDNNIIGSFSSSGYKKVERTASTNVKTNGTSSRISDLKRNPVVNVKVSNTQSDLETFFKNVATNVVNTLNLNRYILFEREGEVSIKTNVSKSYFSIFERIAQFFGRFAYSGSGVIFNRPPSYSNINYYNNTWMEGFEVNVTWIDGVGLPFDRAWIEHNFTGSYITDLMNNSKYGGSIYTYNVSVLQSGSYRFRLCANDTEPAVNCTQYFDITINKKWEKNDDIEVDKTYFYDLEKTGSPVISYLNELKENQSIYVVGEYLNGYYNISVKNTNNVSGLQENFTNVFANFTKYIDFDVWEVINDEELTTNISKIDYNEERRYYINVRTVAIKEVNYSCESNDFTTVKRYQCTFTLNVTDPYLVKNIDILYFIPLSKLPEFDKRYKDLTDYYVDNSKKNISYYENDVNQRVEVLIGNSHSNSSLEYGIHNVTLIYFIPIQVSGGGGGGAAIVPEEKRKDVIEITPKEIRILVLGKKEKGEDTFRIRIRSRHNDPLFISFTPIPNDGTIFRYEIVRKNETRNIVTFLDSMAGFNIIDIGNERKYFYLLPGEEVDVVFYYNMKNVGNKKYDLIVTEKFLDEIDRIEVFMSELTSEGLFGKVLSKLYYPLIFSENASKFEVNENGIVVPSKSSLTFPIGWLLFLMSVLILSSLIKFVMVKIRLRVSRSSLEYGALIIGLILSLSILLI